MAYRVANDAARGETCRGYKWLLGAAATLLAAACAHAAATPSEEAGPPPAHATTPDGAALYQSRCASCHDNATDRTPTREVLSKKPAELHPRFDEVGRNGTDGGGTF